MAERIPRGEWRPFPGLKIRPPSEEESAEPDIREYQHKRYAHEFENAPEPVAPRRPVVLDAPLFGGKKELGTLPYDYQPAVQKALNLIYGQKTLPLYAYPATAPIGRALDAYETAKFIQRDPTDIKNYTGVPGVLHGAGRAAAPAIGVGAGAGIVASDKEPSEDDVVPKSGKPKYAHGGEVADALRIARSKLASGGQPPLMEMLQKTAPGPMGGQPPMGAGKPMGGAPPMGAGKPMGGAPPMGAGKPPMGPMGAPPGGQPPMPPGMMNNQDIPGYASGGGAWTRKEGKSESGGLNEKGRASLRAQGHDIKRPQPEGGSRRDSFCARSAGQMKMFPEAAKDPNSRLRKARRKWNCADGGSIDEAVDLAARKSGGEVWDKPRPKGLGEPKPLSKKAKSSAKARARAAGRPWPNLIDSMNAAKKK